MKRYALRAATLALGGLLVLPLAGRAQTIPTRITIREGNVAVYEFGRGQPTVVCAELRFCVVELQVGETLTDAPILADADSWSVQSYTVGAGADARPEVAVKPLLCGVSTNMVLPTTRRRYELSLLSAPCRAVDDWDHNAAYTRRVRFTYPDDAEWREAQAQAAEPAATADAGRVSLAPGVPVEALRFDYTWERKNGFPWSPVQVFDDGTHMYIRVPASAREHEMPILYVVEPSGERAVLNYATPGDGAFFKTDRIVGHLALVIGNPRRGGRPKVLHIYNRRLSGGR
jgi:type IV secretion system protein TrbG